MVTGMVLFLQVHCSCMFLEKSCILELQVTLIARKISFTMGAEMPTECTFLSKCFGTFRAFICSIFVPSDKSYVVAQVVLHRVLIVISCPTVLTAIRPWWSIHAFFGSSVILRDMCLDFHNGAHFSTEISLNILLVLGFVVISMKCFIVSSESPECTKPRITHWA